jgi:putative flippase GtrA
VAEVEEPDERDLQPKPGEEDDQAIGREGQQPPTSAQMMALRHLEYIADVQGSALSTALVPLREGRRGAMAALWGARRRLLTFAANGLIVFLAGLGLQIALIRFFHLSHVASYVIQTVLSVQLNFVASRFVTWRDRSVPFSGALLRFNLQQLATTGLGMALYAGLDRLGMNYIESNVAVTAVLTPVSFVAGNQWSMAERSTAAIRLRDLPWPLLAVLAVQVLLSLRLVWANTAYSDEALYIYSGGQMIDHWLHGTVVQDYQTYFSGSPAVYPPVAAVANAFGGLVAVRLLSLAFMMGVTALLYATTTRLFGRRAALLGSALFAALGTTQYLTALATYDPMALFLLVLAAYLVVGRENAYDTLTDVAYSTVIAAVALALANADKYATALWDPVVIALAWIAPVVAGYPWRYGLGRALRFTTTLGFFVVVGIAVGKGKYVTGILTTTVARSQSQIGMGQSKALVLQDAWAWVGVVVVIALAGMLFLLGRRGTGALRVMGAVLLLAALAAPLNQARIGTTVSLHKHVVFGAWFGCIIAGYALSRILRNRGLAGIGLACLTFAAPLAFAGQAAALDQTWSHENPAFIAALRPLLHPGSEKYLIEGHAAIPAYYIGPSINSNQWKDEATFGYTDPVTGRSYGGDPGYARAIKNRYFTLIIIDMEDPHDPAIAADIGKYGGYQFLTHLPPYIYGAANYFTVWRVTGGK